jgi:hypothetical protein
LYNRRGLLLAAAAAGPFMILGATAQAQSIGIRQWEGSIARTRAPEQVYAGTMAEWRGLWSRVGSAAPDMFEPGRTSAVGIFLGARAGPGYSVNIVSAIRRRDRIMLVFEEIAPAEVMMAQRMPSAPRPVASGTNLGGGPNVGAAFAPPGVSSLAQPPLPPVPSRPIGPPTSPWAIVLFNRVDLPISVEQRLFR